MALAAAPSDSYTPDEPTTYTIVHTNVLFDTTLSSDARFLFTILRAHCYGTRDICWPGYERLCAIIGHSETTIRACMHELTTAGHVHCTRRGQGRTNLYRVASPCAKSRTSKSEVQEPQPVRSNKTREEVQDEGISNSRLASSTVAEDQDEPSQPHTAPLGEKDLQPTTAQPHAPSAPRRPLPVPERAKLLPYLEDFAPELGDEASLPSTVSRAVNLFHRAHVSVADFTQAMYAARAITKERSASIRRERREASGWGTPDKNRMPYFFAVLEDVLGLRPPAVVRAR